MQPQIITLTTDFGLSDSYVAEMKAVILDIHRSAVIVDVTHNIVKFDIRSAGYILASAAPYFPKGTVHVVVVDPGVGTNREAILIQTKKAFFIGPNNGVLALASKNQGIDAIYAVVNSDLMLPPVSATFHGRDLFAPASAYLVKGIPPSEFGPKLRDIITPKFAIVTKKKNQLFGEILYIDSFGNIITNMQIKDLESIGISLGCTFEMSLHAKIPLKLHSTYMEVEVLQPLALIGSHRFLEISIHRGNAAKVFNAKIGDEIILRSS